MKKILILTSLLAISSAYAELDDYQREMADSIGRDNAATSYVWSTTNNDLIYQATLCGCKTKEDILEFIEIAKQSAHEQRHAINQVKKEQFYAQALSRINVGDHVSFQNGNMIGVVRNNTGKETSIEWPNAKTYTYSVEQFVKLVREGQFAVQN